MAGNPFNSLTGGSKRPASGDRFYAAILSCCLAFLFASTWLQTPITGYHAKAVMGLRASGSPAQPGRAASQSDVRLPISKWFAGNGIDVVWKSSPQGAARLELSLIGKSESSALSRLDTVARRFSSEYFQAQHQAEQEALFADQRARLADARLKEDVLERDFQDALSELQSTASEAEADWRQAQEQQAELARAARAKQQRPQPAPVLNPEWEELSGLLLRQQAEQSRLRMKFTKSHPFAVALDAQIAATKTALEATPRHLKNELRDEKDPAETEGKSTDNDDGELDGPLERSPGLSQPEFQLGALSERLEALRQELAVAREARSRAELLLVETLGAAGGPPWTASLLEPAVIQDVIGGKTTKLGLLIAILIAVLTASGVWGIYSMLVPERFTSGRQFERQLALPLLSIVRSSRSRPAAPELAGERCAWWFLRSCEGALVLLVALALVTLIADSQLTQLFAVDPLRAAGEVVTRWR